MRDLLTSCFMAALVCLSGAAELKSASITLDLDPPGGSISGAPGSTAGWGFVLNNSTADWISVTGSALTFETNPSLGVYTDFIGLQGGPLPSFAIAPSTSWNETFDGSQGAGSYAISNSAVPFAQNSGLLMVNFDVFNSDPTNGGAQTGSFAVSTAFTINVSAAADVPEPSSLSVVAFAFAAWTALRKKIR